MSLVGFSQTAPITTVYFAGPRPESQRVALESGRFTVYLDDDELRTLAADLARYVERLDQETDR